MKAKSLLMMTTLFLVSCGTVYEQAKLPLPPELIVPTISKSEVMCLTDEVRDRIKKRDKLKSARILTLIGIIKTTH